MNTPYRITIRGRVSERTLGPYIDEFVIARTPSTTTLTGSVRDPAHLHGVVTHLTGVGLELISVERVGPSTQLGGGPWPRHPRHDLDRESQ